MPQPTDEPYSLNVLRAESSFETHKLHITERVLQGPSWKVFKTPLATMFTKTATNPEDYYPNSNIFLCFDPEFQPNNILYWWKLTNNSSILFKAQDAHSQNWDKWAIPNMFGFQVFRACPKHSLIWLRSPVFKLAPPKTQLQIECDLEVFQASPKNPLRFF